MRAPLAALCLIAVLAGCTGPFLSDIARNPVFSDFPAPDTTYLVFDAGQGFRVEHYAKSGEALLWAPNAAVIRGRWRLVDRHRIREMGPYMRRAGEVLCLYFGSRREETLGDQEWACRPRLRAADTAVAMLRGDAFGLAGRRVPPFRLERCRPPPVFTLQRDVGC
ncbi:MAG: hypothetical protein AAGC92_05000 [Pseudomonadota bacterium]